MKSTFIKSNIYLLFAILFVCGCSKSSTDDTIDPPVLTTSTAIISADDNSIWSGGNVTTSNYSLTAYGVCWSSTNSQPTTSDSTTSETLYSTTFTSHVTGLTRGKTYYIRAYATNLTGTGYGDVRTVTIDAQIPELNVQVSTLAGNGNAGFSNGTGTAASFEYPLGITLSQAGDLYVADSFNSAIRKVTTAGVVSTVAGTGSIGFSNGSTATAQFYAPSGLTTDGQGNIYIADRGNNMIRKIDVQGNVSTLSGFGNPGSTNGTGTDALFNTPYGITINTTGDLYVTDQGNSLVRKVTLAGITTTLAGILTAGYLDATGTEAYLSKPSGIAIDASGNLLVVEAANHALRKITPDGVVTTVLGGPQATDLLSNPTAVAADNTGNIYIADANGRILRLGTDKVLRTIAGSGGTAGYIDGKGTNARFSNPQGLAADGHGNIYVADYGNHCIRKIAVQ